MITGKQVVGMMDDQWHKVVAIIMKKHGIEKVIITADDIQKIAEINGAVVAHESSSGLEISLLDGAAAKRMALKHGNFHIKE